MKKKNKPKLGAIHLVILTVSAYTQSHEQHSALLSTQRRDKPYAYPSELKVVPSTGVITLSVGFSANNLTAFSNALTRVVQGALLRPVAPIRNLITDRMVVSIILIHQSKKIASETTVTDI